MDDGTPIKLAVTIDRTTRSAIFDFEGTVSYLRKKRFIRNRSSVHAVVPLRLLLYFIVVCGSSRCLLLAFLNNSASVFVFVPVGGLNRMNAAFVHE